MFREAVVSFAGPLAEQRLCSLTPEQCNELWHGAWDTDQAQINRIDPQSQARARAWAQRIVTDYWQEIIRVANMLIAQRTIGQEQVDQCIERQAQADAFFNKAMRPRERRRVKPPPMRGYIVSTK